MVCPANEGSRKEFLIASRLAAYSAGVHGEGDAETKNNGVRTSLHRS